MLASVFGMREAADQWQSAGNRGKELAPCSQTRWSFVPRKLSCARRRHWDWHYLSGFAKQFLGQRFLGELSRRRPVRGSNSRSASEPQRKVLAGACR